MKTSKTKINERMRKKTNSELAETIYLAKKKGLIELATAISVPTRQQKSINLEDLERIKTDEVIVPGKMLSNGEIKRKIKVYALGFSKTAKEKLKKAGCEAKTILEALKENKKLNGEIIN